MITISFIRHGESTDNLRSVWAGWKDAPLSNHGMNQAKACGQSFGDIRLTAIYASSLDRALTTARAIYDSQAEPRPPFFISPDLREQHFGIAEGEPWVVTSETSVDVERKIFPTLNGRDAKFPDAESLNDLEIRANRAVDQLIMPWVWDLEKTYGRVEGEVHLAVVTNPAETTRIRNQLVAALVRKDADGYERGKDFRGLVNTGWTRVTVRLKGEDDTPTPTVTDKTAPLVIRVTHVNQHGHLAGIKRQKGGIGSTAFDPKQKDIRAFFGGAAIGS